MESSVGIGIGMVRCSCVEWGGIFFAYVYMVLLTGCLDCNCISTCHGSSPIFLKCFGMAPLITQGSMSVVVNDKTIRLNIPDLTK